LEENSPRDRVGTYSQKVIGEVTKRDQYREYDELEIEDSIDKGEIQALTLENEILKQKIEDLEKKCDLKIQNLAGMIQV
jgi:cell division ATPase FtsA